MKPLFENIRDQLTQVSGIADAVWDLGQTDGIASGEITHYAYPCAFIRLSVEDWNDLGDRAQQGTVDIRITLVDFDLDADDDNTPLTMLALRDEVHVALHGLKMEDTERYQASPLSRVSEEPTDEVTNLPTWVMTYECELQDLTACPDRKVAQIRQLEINP